MNNQTLKMPPARRSSLLLNDLRSWLRRAEFTEPKCPARMTSDVIPPWVDQLRQWHLTDAHRAKRYRSAISDLIHAIQTLGYQGCHDPVCAFGRRWKDKAAANPKLAAFSLHGLIAALVEVELALDSDHPIGRHVPSSSESSE